MIPYHLLLTEFFLFWQMTRLSSQILRLQTCPSAEAEAPPSKDPESDHFSHLHPTPGSRSPTHPVRTIAVAYSAVGVPMSSLAPTVHSSFGMLCLKSTLTPSLSCSKAPSDHLAAPGIKARGLTMASRPYLVWSRRPVPPHLQPLACAVSATLASFSPNTPNSPQPQGLCTYSLPARNAPPLDLCRSLPPRPHASAQKSPPQRAFLTASVEWPLSCYPRTL